MYLTIVIKLIVGMIGALFFLRLAGKSQMSQMSPADTVNSFVVGALIGGIIYSKDLTIWDMLFAIAMWAIITLILRYLYKINFINHLIHGKSEYVIKDGKLDLKVMQHNNLGLEQLIAKLREQEIYSLFDVNDVRFETNGQFTIYKKKELPPSYLLISNGGILEDNLKDSKKTEEWLKTELSKKGFDHIEDLFCVQWAPDKGFYIVNKEGIVEKNKTKSK